MAERIWSSPRLFAKYDGDREAAKRMERRARGCVGYLMDQLRAAQQSAEDALGSRFKYLKRGLSDPRILDNVAGADLQAVQAEFARRMASLHYPTYRVQTWNYSDGSRIKAHVWRDVLGERARVEIAAVPASVQEDFSVRLLFESGALILTPDIQDVTWEAAIYYGADIGEYFSGTGTQIYNRETKFHLQGVVSYDETDFLPDTNWAKVAPSSSPYPSVRYKNSGGEIGGLRLQLATERYYVLLPATPAVTLSSQYTGVMRLAVQCWMAAGRSPGSQLYLSAFGDSIFVQAKHCPCPFDLVDPHNDGLIHDEGFNFWWVRINFSEVTFVKMKNYAPEFSESVLPNLAPGSEQYETYLQSAIAYLVKDEDFEPVVVTLPELADVLGSGRSPVAHGWHFNRTGTPWRAAIVTVRQGAESTNEDWYQEATLARLDFNFADGVPTATASIIAQDAAFALPSIHSVYYPVGAGFCSLSAPPGVTISQSAADNVPLYCFFSSAGELITLSWTRYLKEHRTSDSIDTAWLPCGPGDRVVQTYMGARYVDVGGFTLGSIDLSDGSESGSQSYTHIFRDSSNGGIAVQTTNSGMIDVFDQGGTQATICGGPQSISDVIGDEYEDWYIPPGGLIRSFAYLSRTSYTKLVSRESYYQFVVIPGYDAEGAFIGHHTKDYVSAHNVVDSMSYGTYIVMADVDSTMVKYAPSAEYEEGPGYTHTYRPYSPNLNTISSTVVPAKTIYGGEVTYVCSTGEHASDSPPYPAWQACLGSNGCDGNCSAEASFGYYSGGMYSKKDEPRGLAFLGGFNYNDSASPRITRWLGKA